jgi:hypothetical protein
MKTNLKPIETFFKGYHFRSRLEARWAVFFEEIGFDWTYEPEGFELPSGAWYLPDFLIKNNKHCYDYFYEIKPKEAEKCAKVKEFKIQLQEAINYECISTKRQDIYQLNGDPIEAINMICPRCKLIEKSLKLEYFHIRDFYLAYKDDDQYTPCTPTPSVFYCYNCDITKKNESGNSTFVEKNAFEHKGYVLDIRWHKGYMEKETFFEQGQRGWEYLYSDLLSASQKARQARFQEQAPTS